MNDAPVVLVCLFFLGVCGISAFEAHRSGARAALVLAVIGGVTAVAVLTLPAIRMASGR